MRRLWLQVEDNDLECLGDFTDALNRLRELDAGQIVCWRPGGLETNYFWGNDYIRLYWGDAEGNLLSSLLPDERVAIEDALDERCFEHSECSPPLIPK